MLYELGDNGSENIVLFLALFWTLWLLSIFGIICEHPSLEFFVRSSITATRYTFRKRCLRYAYGFCNYISNCPRRHFNVSGLKQSDLFTFVYVNVLVL